MTNKASKNYWKLINNFICHNKLPIEFSELILSEINTPNSWLNLCFGEIDTTPDELFEVLYILMVEFKSEIELVKPQIYEDRLEKRAKMNQISDILLKKDEKKEVLNRSIMVD